MMRTINACPAQVSLGRGQCLCWPLCKHGLRSAVTGLKFTTGCARTVGWVSGSCCETAHPATGSQPISPSCWPLGHQVPQARGPTPVAHTNSCCPTHGPAPVEVCCPLFHPCHPVSCKKAYSPLGSPSVCIAFVGVYYPFSGFCTRYNELNYSLLMVLGPVSLCSVFTNCSSDPCHGLVFSLL